MSERAERLHSASCMIGGTGHKRVLVTTSWDDGHPCDMKLSELLSEFGLKGTFYVALKNRERAVMTRSELRELSAQFEIGAHTLTHPDLRRVDDDMLTREVNGSKAELEAIIGARVNMFCYPRGRHNHRVRDAVKRAGFTSARTMQEFVLRSRQDKWRMGTTLLAFPLPRWVRVRHEVITQNWHGLAVFLRHASDGHWVDLALRLFEEIAARGGVWHLWGHSWELDTYGLWDDLKTVFARVARLPNVEYTTNAELVDRADSTPPLCPE